jgi:hypothetical protein
MTFSRTGNTATRVNSSGLIETVNANIPRLDYLDGTCPKLLLEPQRTNLILQSQDISSASWSKPSSPVIVTNVAIAPDGTTTADSIQSTDTSGFKSIKQTNSVTANSTFTFSFFVKKETVRTNYGGVGISLSGGTVKYVFVVFDETNGTQINLTNSTITPILKTEIFGNYYRFIITATDNGSNTTLTSEIYSTLSTNGISYNIAIGSARTIWGSQLEVGSFATSYIPTTTASVTRNADNCSKTAISSLLNTSQGTVYLKGNFGYGTSTLYILDITDGSDANKIQIVYLGNSVIRFRVQLTSGISNVDYTMPNPLSNFTLVGKYSSSEVVFFINGVLISQTTGRTSSGTLNSVAFGQWYSTNTTANINALAIWKTALTNSECLTLSQQ